MSTCAGTHGYPCGHLPLVFTVRLEHLKKQREKLVNEIKAQFQVQ